MIKSVFYRRASAVISALSGSLAIGIALLLLAGCQLISSPHPLKQSPDDLRLYRYVQLDNGLRVLLIKDDHAPYAAAALRVEVGSWDDPPDRQGLAHFVEHMLFLGTRKYPEVGGYQQFVSEHGGTTNAFTSFENTTYYFSIETDFLQPTLDRFADFFKAPLFDADYVQRELQSVEAEYQSGLKQLNRQVLEVVQQQATSHHPFRQLSVGNLQTLDYPDIASRANDFFKRYYTAERMTLAITASKSLDVLEAWARNHFSMIPSSTDGHGRQVDYPPLLPESPDGAGARLLVVNSESPARQIRLNFPLPDIQPYYQYKPMEYITEILGDEGPGSVAHALKAQGLVESLWATVDLQYGGGALFSINIGATETGMERVDFIVGAVFAMTQKLIQELEQHPEIARDRFKELKALAEIDFRFMTKATPVETVLHSTANMQRYEQRHILSGAYEYLQFKPALIRKFAAHITPDNLLLVLVSDRQQGAYIADKQTRWYQARYFSGAIPGAWLSLWQAPDKLMQESGVQLNMPQKNRYIASNFSLVSETTVFPDGAAPQKLWQRPGAEIWYGLDTQFQKPKMSLRIAFMAPAELRTPRQRVLASLYVQSIARQLEPQTYPALRAGLYTGFRSGHRGLYFSLSGYSDKAAVLFGEIAPRLFVSSVDAREFTVLKEGLQKKWQRASQARPDTQLDQLLDSLLYENDWGWEVLLGELDTVTLEEFNAFPQQFFSRSYVQALVHGNVDARTAEEIAELIAQQLNCRCQGQAQQRVSVRVLNGPQEYHRQHVLQNDTAVMLYFQAPDDTMESIALSWLSAEMIAPRFYRELRTEKQLGYIVTAQNHMLHQWPGFLFRVQSPTHDKLAIYREMRAFAARLVEEPPVREQFERYKANLITQLQQPDSSLYERTGRYWHGLLRGDEQLAFREALVRALERTDYSRWRDELVRQLDGGWPTLLLSSAPASAGSPAGRSLDQAASLFEVRQTRRQDY